MSNVYDFVLASSDLSLDRVLGVGRPVALVFYDGELPADLRQMMENLARQYAGKVLIVMLARNDAPQAISRFGVRQFPSLVAVRDGKTMTSAAGVRPGDLKPHIAYLLGEAPLPASRAAPQPKASQKAGSGGGPITVGEANFEQEVLRADRPVLVDFWAPWCAPCHMVAPTVEALAREHGNALKVAKVNVDENPRLAGRYHAMSIPTMIVIKDGREVDRWAGALPDKTIRNRVMRWIDGKPRSA